ncbi:hypothetical protein DER44DRAFT_779710 [Fusarium oxysporum]|nr:hypothetical protein DER44DRAFT_779710 [Fusarium oxysporum]
MTRFQHPSLLLEVLLLLEGFQRPSTPIDQFQRIIALPVIRCLVSCNKGFVSCKRRNFPRSYGNMPNPAQAQKGNVIGDPRDSTPSGVGTANSQMLEMIWGAHGEACSHTTRGLQSNISGTC